MKTIFSLLLLTFSNISFANSALYLAVVNNNFAEVKRIITTDPTVKINDYFNGETILTRAAYLGSFKITEYLLDHKADIEKRSYGCSLESPLFAAIMGDKANIVSLLVSKGAKVETPGCSGTPLMYASARGIAEIVETLIKSGANVNVMFRLDSSSYPPIKERSPLMWARTPAVADLLLKNGAQLELANSINETALYVALLGERFEVVKFLINAHANPNVKLSPCSHTGCSPLHLLVNGRYKLPEAMDLFKLLVEAGANVNMTDFYGENVLSNLLHNRAPLEKEKLMTSYLLEKGAEVNQQDDRGNPPLFFCYRGECVDTLMAHGADIRIINKQGDNALTFVLGSVVPASTEAPMKLIDYGVDIKVKGARGNTALEYILYHILITHDEVNQADYLIFRKLLGRVVKLGADVNNRTDTGLTPLLSLFSLTVMSPLKFSVAEEITNILIDAGADVHAVNATGENVLFSTLERNFPLMKMTEKFLEMGVNATLANKKGETLLSTEACSHLRDPGADVIRLILNHRTPVKDLAGAHALDCLIWKGNDLASVYFLLNAGAKGYVNEERNESTLKTLQNSALIRPKDKKKIMSMLEINGTLEE